MIAPLAQFKVEAAVVAGTVVIGTVITKLAMSEEFMGQVLASIIGSLAPMAMVVIALISIKRGQEKTLVALDGKLDKLMTAEKGVSKAEGVKEERQEARDRAGVADSAAATVAIVAATVAAVKSTPATPDAVTKMEVVNTEENPVPVKPGAKGLL